MSPPQPPHAVPAAPIWSEPGPLRALLGLERRWFGQNRSWLPTGTMLWLAPGAEPNAEAEDFLPLRLEAGGVVAGSIRAHAAELPFADHSVRAIVLQHAFDQDAVPVALFGECVRCLASPGELTVFGLNPWSAWNAWLRVSAHGRAPRPRMVGRLRALLTQLGLGFVDVHWLGGLLPDEREFEGNGARGATRALRAAYVLRMRKSSDTVIPLQPRLAQRDMAMANGLVPSGARRMSAGA